MFNDLFHECEHGVDKSRGMLLKICIKFESASIRKLLAEGLQHWKEQRALIALGDGKMSFLKAAQMAGLSVWDFADLVREKGIVWIKSEKFASSDIKKALQ